MSLHKLFPAWPLPAFTEEGFCCWYQLRTWGITQVVKTAFSVPYNQIAARTNVTFSRYNLLKKKVLVKNKRTREERSNQEHELNVWDRWGSFNSNAPNGAPNGQNAHSLRPTKLARQGAAQEIWELVRKQLAYSSMKNVVQYISPGSVAETYRWVSLVRNTGRRSSAKRNGILSIRLRHMLYEFASPKDFGKRK